jgi:SAM-dependent methyltransferase
MHAPPLPLAPGARVSIHGLQGRADLNGKDAELMHYVVDAQRWACYVLGSGEAVRVKPQNLLAVVGSTLEAAARVPFWHQAKQCLDECAGDFAMARTVYYRAMERQLRDADPALHEELKANRSAGPGLVARVALTFDTAAAFLRSAQSGQEDNPGLANEQHFIAQAACAHAAAHDEGGHGAGGGGLSGARVLDVGCGDGAFAPMLAACGASKAGYLGIDLSHNMISRAKLLQSGFAFERVNFMTSSLCAPPFTTTTTATTTTAAAAAAAADPSVDTSSTSSADPDVSDNVSDAVGAPNCTVAHPAAPEGFDTVLLHATLQYLPDPAAAIARAAGCLRTDKPVRIVVAQVTGASFVRREHAKHPAVAVVELPSPSELRELGAAHGFSLLPRPPNVPPLDEFYLLVLSRPALLDRNS